MSCFWRYTSIVDRAFKIFIPWCANAHWIIIVIVCVRLCRFWMRYQTWLLCGTLGACGVLKSSSTSFNNIMKYHTWFHNHHLPTRMYQLSYVGLRLLMIVVSCMPLLFWWVPHSFVIAQYQNIRLNPSFCPTFTKTFIRLCFAKGGVIFVIWGKIALAKSISCIPLKSNLSILND